MSLTLHLTMNFMSEINSQVTIPLTSKFTIIRGKTSSGKSFTVQNIGEFIAQTSGYVVDEIQNEDVTILNEQSLNIPPYKQGQVFIADEYFKIFNKIPKIKRTNAYFVIISRKNLGQLKMHCNNVFELDDTDPYNLKTVSVYEKLKPLELYPHYDVVITEDMRSSFDFLKELQSFCTVYDKVISAEGKDNILTTLEDLYLQDPDITVLIVYDSAAFGFLFEELFQYIQVFNIKCTVIDWDSFEGYLYNCFFTPKVQLPEVPYYNDLETVFDRVMKKNTLYRKDDLQCYSPKQGCNFCDKKNGCSMKHSRSQLIHSQLLSILGYDVINKLVNKDIQDSKELMSQN